MVATSSMIAGAPESDRYQCHRRHQRAMREGTKKRSSGSRSLVAPQAGTTLRSTCSQENGERSLRILSTRRIFMVSVFFVDKPSSCSSYLRSPSCPRWRASSLCWYRGCVTSSRTSSLSEPSFSLTSAHRFSSLSERSPLKSRPPGFLSRGALIGEAPDGEYSTCHKGDLARINLSLNAGVVIERQEVRQLVPGSRVSGIRLRALLPSSTAPRSTAIC